MKESKRHSQVYQLLNSDLYFWAALDIVPGDCDCRNI